MYRAPPDVRKGPVGGPFAVTETGEFRTENNLTDKRFALRLQAPLFTAIPIGPHAWTVKAVAATGERVTVGEFHDRLSALGASVLLAEQCGGTVRP